MTSIQTTKLLQDQNGHRYGLLSCAEAGYNRGVPPIHINCRAVALQTHVVVRDGASKAGTISHDNDILWGPEAPKPPPGGIT